MAPPTSRPRLHAIDPAALALSITRSLAEHVGSMLDSLYGIGQGPVLDLYREEEILRLAASPWGAIPDAVRTLAAYARDGVPLDAPVQEYLITLIPLWSAPLGDADVTDLGSDADPDTEIGCVIRAALAREQIEIGHESLTASQLGVLAGIDERQVRQLIASGELAGALDGRTYRVEPSEARRWLAARGVAGIRPCS